MGPVKGRSGGAGDARRHGRLGPGQHGAGDVRQRGDDGADVRRGDGPGDGDRHRAGDGGVPGRDVRRRSDGLLGRRAKGADREDFAYDLLGRLTGAEAYLDGSRTAGRTLSYGYDALGNLTSKTSDAAGDADAASYAYDADGHVTRHDAATGEDAFIEWNGRGLPSRITVGATAADAAPKARDEFRYGPAGERYHRRITWREELADGTTRTRTAEAYRVGAYERVVGDAHAAHAQVEKTHVGPALEVRTSATSSAPVFEYVHADHLGSAAAVAALAAGQDAGRARSGFTGHEPLDRTGFVHMNGRLYDPRVGRFLSPDPIVSEPWSGQGWNPYSYVGNSPLSRTDPTGYCYNPRYPCPMHANQGGGFASGTATLLSRSLSWRVPIVLAVHWGPVSFGIGWGGFLNGGDDGGGYFGSFFGGFYRPYVSVGFGAPYPVVTSTARTVALGQEPVPADGPMALEPIVDIAADVGEWVFDFLIWDTVETGMQTYEDFRVGNYGAAAFGVVLMACDVVKACKIGGKILKRVPGVERFGGWIRGKLGLRSAELGKGDQVVTRTTRGGLRGARITRTDGSVIDISPTRVKEYTPNTYPDAPPGTLQRTKFENSLPKSKGFKRVPTKEELDLLDDLTR